MKYFKRDRDDETKPEPIEETIEDGAGVEAPPPPAAEPVPEPEKKKRGFWAKVFAPDTRFGRFNRAALRWTALVLSMFLLGALTVYLLLYRPLQQQISPMQTNADQSRQNAQTAETQMKTVESENSRLQAENQTLTSELEAANQHVQLLALLNRLHTARTALMNKDTVASRTLLGEAKTMLEGMAPSVAKTDKALADSLTSRLELVTGELSRDSKTAISDLDILINSLEDYEKSAFQP